MTLKGRLRGLERRLLVPVAGAIPAPLLRRWTRLAGWTAAYSARTQPGAETLHRALELIMAPQRGRGTGSGVLHSLSDIAERLRLRDEDVQLWADSGLLGEPVDPGPSPGYSAEALDRARLVAYLHRQGVSDDAIREAAAQDRLALLIVDRAFAGRGRHTGADVGRLAGVSPEFAMAVGRASGMPAAAWSERIFTRRDVEALRITSALRGLLTDEDILDAVAVMGRAMAQVASAEVDIFRRTVRSRLAEQGLTELDAALRTAAVVDLLVGPAAVLLDVAHRRHLEAAAQAESMVRIEEATGRLPSQTECAIGFADLVGYTAASERLSALELGEMASSLLRAAEAAFPDHRTRVVKSIGDAVMFMARETVHACSAAVELVSAARTAGLPALHVGLAAGPVLSRHADYFGRTVNIASRLCAAAPGETVLLAGPVDEATAAALADAGLEVGKARTMRLKGLSEPQEAVTVTARAQAAARAEAEPA